VKFGIYFKSTPPQHDGYRKLLINQGWNIYQSNTWCQSKKKRFFTAWIDRLLFFYL